MATLVASPPAIVLPGVQEVVADDAAVFFKGNTVRIVYYADPPGGERHEVAAIRVTREMYNRRLVAILPQALEAALEMRGMRIAN